MSFVATLRAATAADHAHVDARFGALRLDDAAEYRVMLQAHARALPAVEAALAEGAGAATLPDWRPRALSLAADLTDLEVVPSPPLPFAEFDTSERGDGARWGALYVLEGSRLGGQLLARGVAADLPHRYLSARHLPGEWRALLAAFDARAAAASPAWREGALEGARATFALYATAAALEGVGN